MKIRLCLFDRPILEITINRAEPETELRAAARCVLGLIPDIALMPGVDPPAPTFDWSRRHEAWPALDDLRRLAGLGKR